ncbi:MAG TPA: archease [Bryobacteraceae bacterium]|nr:archease [Bryobacteraceae bacterium]
MKPRPSNNWEHFSHSAGIGVRGIGPTIEEAFEEAAVALIAMRTDVHALEAKSFVKVVCEAPNDELLFVDWLNAINHEMATRGMLFCKFQVELDRGRLEGTIWGQPVDFAKRQPAVKVKSAGYTALEVKQREDGRWIAQCLVDV